MLKIELRTSTSKNKSNILTSLFFFTSLVDLEKNIILID